MHHRTIRLVVLALTLLSAAPVLAGVNSPVTVGDGQTRSSGASTVNGSIRVGADATVEGICRTVNGSVRVGDGARVEGLRTVNGTIRVGENVVIEDGVETVNGRIELERGTRVEGVVQTVNGGVEISAADITGLVRTTNGRVVIADGATVDGDIVIAGRSKRGWFWGGGDRKALEIELSGGSVVTGDVIVEDPDRDVVVVLRQDSEVRGRVEGAELVRKR